MAADPRRLVVAQLRQEVNLRKWLVGDGQSGMRLTRGSIGKSSCMRCRTAVTGMLGSVVLAGCAGSTSPPTPTVPAATLQGKAPMAHLATIGRGSTRLATLDLASGATTVDIRVGTVPGDLLVATTPLTSGQSPILSKTSNSAVDLQLASSGGGVGPSAVGVVLSSSVAWTVDLDGGATEEHIDMRGGHLVELDLAAGTTRATIVLPTAPGTQLIRESGGASELTMTVPSSVMTRVHVGGGAGSVQIGSVTHSGVGANETFTAAGYPHASARVDLQLLGGVSAVQVR